MLMRISAELRSLFNAEAMEVRRITFDQAGEWSNGREDLAQMSVRLEVE